MVVFKGDFVPAGDLTGVNVSSGVSANLHTNVPDVLVTTPSATARSGSFSHLYSLGVSPIRVNEVEKSLFSYPLQNTAKELIYGLTYGFKLQYSGTRLPVKAKNSKSVS